MNSTFLLIDAILDLYSWVIIIAVILSWLSSLNIINNSNQIVRMFHETAWRLTDPVFRKIRSFLPNFGGLDISYNSTFNNLFFKISKEDVAYGVTRYGNFYYRWKGLCFSS